MTTEKKTGWYGVHYRINEPKKIVIKLRKEIEQEMMMLSEAELTKFKKKQKEKKQTQKLFQPVKIPASAYANPQKSAETRKGRLPHRTDKYRYGMSMKVSPGFLRKQGSLLTTAINTFSSSPNFGNNSILMKFRPFPQLQPNNMI